MGYLGSWIATLHRDEREWVGIKERVAVRLAQVITNLPFDCAPANRDVIRALLLWETVIWPIVSGRSSWITPPETGLTATTAPVINKPPDTPDAVSEAVEEMRKRGKVTKGRSAPSTPRTAGRKTGRKAGPRSEIEKGHLEVEKVFKGALKLRPRSSL